MRLRHLFLVASLGALAAFAACTLNPQPLPPGDDRNQATNGDGSARSDSGAFGTDPEVPADAAEPPPNADDDGGTDAAGDIDGGADAADASDSG